ncbi:hypothetical protein Btru_067846 [Bulinus truncatus]|nr:hypothetical protein Btru_067846 [Bulinus truncatus]
MNNPTYVEESNLRLLQRLRKGDIVKIPTETHTHCGIYVGEYNIVHISAALSNSCGGEVTTVNVISFMTVAKGCIAYVEYEGYASFRPLLSTQVVSVAKRSLGESLYEARFQSCQHFVDWCRSGNNRDEQEDFRKVKESGIYKGERKVIFISLYPQPEVKEESILTFVNGNVVERDIQIFRHLDRDAVAERARNGVERSYQTLVYQSVALAVVLILVLFITSNPLVAFIAALCAVPILYQHARRHTPRDTWE